jgi:hypothetical protein
MQKETSFNFKKNHAPGHSREQPNRDGIKTTIYKTQDPLNVVLPNIHLEAYLVARIYQMLFCNYFP